MGSASTRQDRVLRILGVASVVLMAVALYMGLIYAPPEVRMGDVQRIMYVHVGSAYAAYASFAAVFVGSLVYLFRRREAWDLFSEAAAEVGVLFTTVTIVTGSLWGKAEWGTWWDPDPRLTLTVIMWFLYIGYLVMRAALDHGERRALLSAVYGIVAVITLPLVHFSVEWWASLHPNILRAEPEEGSSLDPRMRNALMVAMLAFWVVSLYLVALRYRVGQLRQRNDRLKAELRDLIG